MLLPNDGWLGGLRLLGCLLFTLALGCRFRGLSHVFSRLWQGGFHGIPLRVLSSFANGQITKIHGLPTDSEAGCKLGGFEQFAAAPGDEIINLAEHAVADHFQADFVPGAGRQLGGEPGKDDGLVRTFMVVVIARNGHGRWRDHDAGHVIFDGVDGEAGAFSAFKFEFVLDDEILKFVRQSCDGTMLVRRDFSAAHDAFDQFPFALGGLPWSGRLGIELAFIDD